MRLTSITSTRLKPISRETIQTTIHRKVLSIYSLVFLLIAVLSFFSIKYFVEVYKNFYIGKVVEEISQSRKKEVDTKIENLFYKLRTFFHILKQKSKNEKENSTLKKEFLNNNPDIIFAGISEVKQSKINIEDEIIQNEFFNLNKLDQSTLPLFHEIFQSEILKLETGSILFLNATDKFSTPVIAFSFPFDNLNEKTIISYIPPNTLVDSVDFKFDWILISENDKILSQSLNLETFSKDKELIQKIINHSIKENTKMIQSLDKELVIISNKLSNGNLRLISIFDLDNILEESNSLYLRNIYILILSFLIGFIFIYLLSETISKRILKLVDIAEEIEIGNYEIQFDSSTKDEVNQLGHSLVQMAGSIKEKEVIKNVFGKYINPEISKRIKNNNIEPKGSIKDSTLLVSTLNNFYELVDKNDPSKSISLLNQYLNDISECIYDHNGLVDKYIGETIFSNWGAFFSIENQEEFALDSALQIRKSLQILNMEISKSSKNLLKVGIFIQNQKTILAQIGSNQKQEFTLLYENILEIKKQAELNFKIGSDIITSENVFLKTKEYFDFIKYTDEFYIVLGRKGDATSPKNLDELKIKLGTF
jgi:adenylate cyclase